MRIFTPCLFFQCVFTNFQCVITLLRALSVALIQGHHSGAYLKCFNTKQDHCNMNFPLVSKTRAPRGTDRSPEYNEHFLLKAILTCQKFDFRNGTKKQQHLISHASRSLLCIRFVVVAFQSKRRSFLKTGTPNPQ